jgi:LPS sulfotransferase NodH
MTPLRQLDADLYPWQSAHQVEIEAQFGDRLLRPLTDEEQAFLANLEIVLVAFTNRSGSNLLCSLLNRAGLGIPEASEPLNRTTALPLIREHAIPSFTDYLLGYLQGWQRDGRVGIKIGPQQLFWLKHTGLLRVCRRVLVVDCRRRDRLDQAISHYVARASGQWHSGMAATGSPVAYAAEEILRSLEDIGRGRELIERYLAIHQTPVLPVYYEDLLANPRTVVSEVVTFAGATATADPAGVQPGLEKQGGELNREFRRRFLAEFGED